MPMIILKAQQEKQEKEGVEKKRQKKKKERKRQERKEKYERTSERTVKHDKGGNRIRKGQDRYRNKSRGSAQGR